MTPNRSFFTSLSDHSDNTLIKRGDFNMVSDSGVDRVSTSGSQQNWQSTNIVKQYMNDFGICDAWRSHHPTLREYTFFSPVNHSYSRIDYFLVSSSFMNDISDSKIHPITISDHTLVSITLKNNRVTPIGDLIHHY